MALTNNLKPQVDTPIWEWCRLAPAVSSAVSASCAADNSLYHVSFGRYIYYMQAAATLSSSTALTGFFRYDTISDSYQLLAQPPIAPATLTGLQFAGGQGYVSRVISAGANTITAAALTGQSLKGFDIRIIEGTGDGQQRIITGVEDAVIADSGTATSAGTSPQAIIVDTNKNWVINQWVGYQVRLVSTSGQSQVRKIMYNSSNTLFIADVAKFAEDPFTWNPITTVAGSTQVITAVGSPYQIESSVITVEQNWAITPDTTSVFVVRAGAIWMLSSGTTYTMQYYDIAADSWYIRNAGAATSPVTAVGGDGTIVNSGENATVWERGIALGTHSTTTLQDTTKNWGVNQWAGYYLRIVAGTGENQLRAIASNTANTLTWVSVGTAPTNTSRYAIDAFEAGTLSSADAMTQTGSSTGSITSNVFTAGATTGVYYPGQILTGTGVQATKAVLSPSLACFTTGNSTTVNFATGNPSSLGIVQGMVVSVAAGTGTITIGTTVSAVSSTTVTLSAATTVALSSATLLFSSAVVGTGSSSVGLIVTTSSTTNMYPGGYVTVLVGTGTFLAGTYVAGIIDGTRFTVSVAPSVALSGATIQVQPYQTVITGQLSGVLGGAGTYSVFPSQTVASTTIVGTGIGTVTDTTKSWLPDRWNNYAIRIKSGTGVGQVRRILRTFPGAVVYTSSAGATSADTLITVSDTTSLTVGMALNITAGLGAFAPNTYVTIVNSATTFTVSTAPTTALSGGATVVTGAPYNTLGVSPAWDIAPDNTSTYVIHGDGDKNFFSLATNHSATFIHNIESDMVTTGRLLDSGAARGVSAQYGSYRPVAIASGVPVLPITSAVGFLAVVATTGGSNTANIATLTLTTAATSGVFPVGSWINVAGVTPTVYNGTWQVSASSIGSVSFYSTTATGTVTIQGTVGQANSIVLGGTLANGAHLAFGAGTTMTISGAVPVAYNATFTVSCGAGGTTGTSYGGYVSAAGATSSGATITVTDTTNLKVGMIPVVTAGVGTFAAGTVVTSITNGTTFVVNTAPSVALSGGASVITVTPSVAFAAGTVPGNMTTLGVVNKVIQATVSGSRSGSATATVTCSNTIFPVGSSIIVSGCTPATYNGVFTVTAASAGSVSYVTTVSTTDTITVQGTIGIATPTILATTVNSHSFQTGQSLTIRGDQGFSSSVTNTTAAITVISPAVIGNATTLFTYPTASVAGQMIVYPQSTSQLQDAAKNWVPNQWAGCLVTYNSTQFTTANVQPTILTAYILANTATTLIFAAAHSAAPAQGISRYVITAPATYPVGNIVGEVDCGLAQGVQSTTVLTDVTKSWATPAVVSTTGSSIAAGTTVTLASIAGLYPGMLVAVTLGNVTLPANTVINSINPSTLVATLSNSFSGAGTTATLSFLACCNSSGNVITVSGYPLTNLAVGMNVGVTSTTNLSPSVTTAGAFVINGGTNLTPVKVTGITSATTFTVSAVPTVPLVNATVQASFWFPGQFINRRLRLITGNTTNNLELTITANTFNTITTAAFASSPVHGVTGYAIMQQPLRGLGTQMYWNYGVSDTNRKGKYFYQARGGNVTGFDRLNLNTDKWEFLTPTPNYEPLTTGAMSAYDGINRIYFTVQVTQRVYYYDLDTNVIHPAGQYPYVAGTAIIGNRMEIYETTDGLKYLWLNRHSFQECFKQLLWY